jgi:hypothetical protein
MNSAGAEEQMHKLAELAGKFNAQLSEDPSSQVSLGSFNDDTVPLRRKKCWNISLENLTDRNKNFIRFFFHYSY